MKRQVAVNKETGSLFKVIDVNVQDVNYFFERKVLLQDVYSNYTIYSRVYYIDKFEVLDREIDEDILNDKYCPKLYDKNIKCYALQNVNKCWLTYIGR